MNYIHILIAVITAFLVRLLWRKFTDDSRQRRLDAEIAQARVLKEFDEYEKQIAVGAERIKTKKELYDQTQKELEDFLDQNPDLRRFVVKDDPRKRE